MDELDALIAEAGRRGYLWHQFRVDQYGPDVLAGVFRWGRCVDVVVLTDEKGSHAYRMPSDAAFDVFAPSHVHWWYGRIDSAVRLPAADMVLPGVSMVWVVRALLTLPDPGEPGSMPRLIPAPPGTGISGDRVPVRITSKKTWRDRDRHTVRPGQH